jgi:hypothetical protein
MESTLELYPLHPIAGALEEHSTGDPHHGQFCAALAKRGFSPAALIAQVQLYGYYLDKQRLRFRNGIA